jgi:hypothetical protein
MNSVPSNRNGRKVRRRRSRGVGRNFYAKILPIALVAAVAIGGALIFFLLFSSSKDVAPNSDLEAVIMSQSANNETIGDIGWDAGVKFADHKTEMVKNASLQPIENNFAGEGESKADDDDLLYDELAIGRVMKYNSDWVKYSLEGDDSVFDSVSGKAVKEKVIARNDGAQVAFHSLKVGEVKMDGNSCYVIVNERYTLAKDGGITPVENVVIYELKEKGNTLYIKDFEKV